MKGIRKLVLVALADYADKQYQCWPIMEKLANKCGLTKRSTITNVQALVDDGYLTKEKRWRSGGGQSSSCITLNVTIDSTKSESPSPTKSESPSPPRVNMVHPKSESPSPPRVNMTTSMGEGDSLFSIEEPPLKSNHHLEPPLEPLSSSARPVEKKSTSSRGNHQEEVKKVFDHWRQTMNHPRAVLDDDRKKNIRNALKWGYSVEDLKQAISGCAITPHNIGQNDRGQRYDGLHIILRKADQIDRFMRNCHQPPQSRNKAQQRAAGNAHVLDNWAEQKRKEMEHAVN